MQRSPSAYVRPRTTGPVLEEAKGGNFAVVKRDLPEKDGKGKQGQQFQNKEMLEDPNLVSTIIEC